MAGTGRMGSGPCRGRCSRRLLQCTSLRLLPSEPKQGAGGGGDRTFVRGRCGPRRRRDVRWWGPRGGTSHHLLARAFAAVCYVAVACASFSIPSSKIVVVVNRNARLRHHHPCLLHVVVFSTFNDHLTFSTPHRCHTSSASIRGQAAASNSRLVRGNPTTSRRRHVRVVTGVAARQQHAGAVDVDAPEDAQQREMAARLDEVEHDRRPHEQRVSGPRPARRLNHAFRYLYRTGNSGIETLPDDPHQFFLSVGYTDSEVGELSRRFPPLLTLSVSGQLAPKVRFVQETIGLDLTNATERQWVPPEFYGLKLEAVVAPRHAFLMHAQLPCGRRLVEESSVRSNPVLWSQFVKNCRQSTKHFAAFCQSLQLSSSASSSTTVYPVVTSRHVEAFQTVFSRGLLAAARNDLVQPGNAVWDPMEILQPLDSSDLVSLLIAHGANATERDHRGATLLHWACGTGNLKAARVLSQFVPVTASAERDGATPLHWAAAGATPHEFGTGGHADVCQYLMDQIQRQSDPTQSHNAGESPLRLFINRPTKDGNTPLMWAAWSGTLDTVKLLVRSRADVTHQNRNGCTVAHWAASGGNLDVCRYLHDVTNVDFAAPNRGGNTPLTHAVAFGRADVVEWLTKEVLVASRSEVLLSGFDDDIDVDATSIAAARNLAENMVRWTGGEQHDRNQVLRLFEEWAQYEVGGAPQQASSDPPVVDDEDTLLL